MTEAVNEPAKVLRIGSMVKQLLDEVRAAPLDERSRVRLREIYEQSIRDLADGLSPDLVTELEALAPPFDSDAPSEAELRIAQAQLVGWLEGLFHGIQATLISQQMAARAQLDEIRQRSLPSGRRVRPDRGLSLTGRSRARWWGPWPTHAVSPPEPSGAGDHERRRGRVLRRRGRSRWTPCVPRATHRHPRPGTGSARLPDPDADPGGYPPAGAPPHDAAAHRRRRLSGSPQKSTHGLSSRTRGITGM